MDCRAVSIMWAVTRGNMASEISPETGLPTAFERLGTLSGVDCPPDKDIECCTKRHIQITFEG